MGAVDFTGDGQRDIWRSMSDALASTANYLSESGWNPDVRWGFEVVLPDGFDFEWTELALQEKLAGNTAILAFTLAIVFATPRCMT